MVVHNCFFCRVGQDPCLSKLLIDSKPGIFYCLYLKVYIYALAASLKHMTTTLT
jgi:hypothetical protein